VDTLLKLPLYQLVSLFLAWMLLGPFPMILYRVISLSWTEMTMALDSIRVEWSQYYCCLIICPKDGKFLNARGVM
jgi:hypothetical protein